jgi:hypothetical protein
MQVNTTIRGSLFERLLYRPGNWMGELGEPNMSLEVSQERSSYLFE